MAIAALVLLAVPLGLLVIGGLIVARSASALRREPRGRAAEILGVVAGAGVLLCAPLSVLGILLEVPYGIVIYPVLAMLIAAVWAVVFLVAAAAVRWVGRRR